MPAHRLLVVVLLFGVILSAGSASPAQASPSDLDPSFGTGGKAVVDFVPPLGSHYGLAAGGVLQPDGKVVVVGSSVLASGVHTIVVARYLADGTADPTFGGTGLATILSGTQADAVAVALRPDGHIVVLGSITTVVNPSLG